ncbi:MAG: dipeptidase [Thermoleophilia bacterium]
MPSADALARAGELHRSLTVVECHGDVPMDVWRRRRAGERAPIADDYLGRWRTAGVDVEFMTVGGDMPLTMDAVGRPELRALELIDDVVSDAEACPGVRVVRSRADLDEALAAGQVALVLHLEGLMPVKGRVDLARTLHRLGVRSAQPTWNVRNEVADGIGEPSPAGLSAAGREVIAELDRLGVLLDVSHLAPAGFWELTELVRGPIVASHANAAALCRHPRNLEDDQIRAIAASGGLVGAVFFPAFIGSEPTLERLIDHVDHLVEVAGIDHVGVGPDYVDFARDLMVADMTYGGSSVYAPDGFDFPEGLRRVETLPVFTAGLLERGYAEADVARILGGNMLRVLRQVLP